MREAVADACARPEPWPARVCAAVEAALRFAAADPAPELVEFILLPYIGHARAKVWARRRRVDPALR